MTTLHPTTALVAALVVGSPHALGANADGANTDADAQAHARDLADLALVARAERRHAAAARLLDRAHDAAPHPLYRLGAGEAYLLDGELEVAERRLKDALDQPDALTPVARVRAAALLDRARNATTHVARARAAAPADAARAWELAFDAADVGRFLVQAGMAWEAAGDFARAADAYARALQRDDLAPDVAGPAAIRLVHARAAIPPPPPDRSAAWITVGFGAAALAFAGAAIAVADGHEADVNDAISRADGGVVTAISRADAQRAQAAASDWRTAAWIGLGAASALLATGAVLLATSPDEPDQGVHLRAGLTPAGLVLGAQTRW